MGDTKFKIFHKSKRRNYENRGHENIEGGYLTTWSRAKKERKSLKRSE